MATRLNEIYKKYQEELEKAKRELTGSSEEEMKSQAFLQIPKDLSEDEYSTLKKIDGPKMFFSLKKMSKTRLEKGLRENGYKAIRGKDRKTIWVSKPESITVYFDISGKTPYLVSSAFNNQKEVASFLKTIYSKTK